MRGSCIALLIHCQNAITRCPPSRTPLLAVHTPNGTSWSTIAQVGVVVEAQWTAREWIPARIVKLPVRSGPSHNHYPLYAIVYEDDEARA